MCVVAIGLRVGPWLRPGTLTGVLEYDDGVYYAAAKMLVHGLLPYRDVTIVHPPASSLLLAPFAGLGSWWGDPVGLALARAALVAVAVGNCTLVYRLVVIAGPDRSGAVGGLLAATLYAVSPVAVGAEHTVLLEPLVNFFCLWALVVLAVERSTTRLVIAGALIAAGSSVKLFGCAYLVALLAAQLVRRDGRGARRLLLGAAAGTAIVDGPFIFADPDAAWHDVVSTQLHRPADLALSGTARLLDLYGLSTGPRWLGIGLLLAIGLVTVRRVTPGSRPWFWLGLTGLVSAALLTSPSYFSHYGAFLAPAVAVLLGTTTAPLLKRWDPLTVCTVAVLLPVLAGSSVKGDQSSQGQDHLRALGARVPKGACVFLERASAAVAADLLAVPRPGCPGWVDGRGVAYTLSTTWPPDRPFYDDGFTSNARWQGELLDQLRHADYLLLGPPSNLREWSQPVRGYATQHFHEIAAVLSGPFGSTQLWQRDLPSTVAGGPERGRRLTP